MQPGLRRQQSKAKADAQEGTVKLRHNVSTEDVMTLDTRSTKTTKMRPNP